MRCNFPIDNSTCRIVNNILHLSNRTIRIMPFSDGIYSTVLHNPLFCVTFNHPGYWVWHLKVCGHSVGNLVPAAPWKRYQAPSLDSDSVLSHNRSEYSVYLIFLSELLRVWYWWHGSTKGKTNTKQKEKKKRKKKRESELSCSMHKLWIAFRHRVYSLFLI